MDDHKKEIRFFNKKRLTKIIGFFFGGIALIFLLGAIGSRYQNLRIDWSFLLPLGGFVGAAIPLFSGIIGWLEGKLKIADDRLDKLEVLVTAQTEEQRRSNQDRVEIRKIVLKVEARLESLRDNQVGSQLGELMELNRQLLKKVDKDD